MDIYVCLIALRKSAKSLIYEIFSAVELQVQWDVLKSKEHTGKTYSQLFPWPVSMCKSRGSKVACIPRYQDAMW